MTSDSTCVWEKVAPPSLTMKPHHSFPLCVSNCYHDAEAQGDWVLVSLCSCPLRRTHGTPAICCIPTQNPRWFPQRTAIPTFVGALFTKTNTQKQPRCLTIRQWLYFIHKEVRMEYVLYRHTRKKYVAFVPTYLNRESILLNEMKKR